MPAKLDDPTSLRFLYCCMSHSNYSTIDYNAVGRSFNIKAPAARMRFTRFRESLDPYLLNHKKMLRNRGWEKKRKREREGGHGNGNGNGNGKEGKGKGKQGFENAGNKGFWPLWDVDDNVEEKVGVGVGGRGVNQEEKEEDGGEEGAGVMKRLRSCGGEGGLGSSMAKKMEEQEEDAKFEPIVGRLASVEMEMEMEMALQAEGEGEPARGSGGKDSRVGVEEPFGDAKEGLDQMVGLSAGGDGIAAVDGVTIGGDGDGEVEGEHEDEG